MIERLLIGDDLAVVFREATPEDESFVFSGWLQGHRKHGDWPRLLSSRRYFAEHKEAIARLIAAGRTVVACREGRPTQAFGFVCFGGRANALHWVYVKQTYRGNGIGRALLERAGVSKGDTVVPCSHWSEAMDGLWKRGFCVSYNPFLLDTFR